MTDALQRDAESERRHIVRESRDVEALASFLASDRLHGAYVLAQLEPDAFPHSRWWLSDGPDGQALVCHSRAGLGDATYVSGPAAGVGRILSIHPGPYHTFVTARPAHIEALESVYTLRSARTMVRMHVTGERFAPVEGGTFRLRPAHARALNRLYSSEGGPTSYQPRHLSDGCYYGVQEAGRLLAVAGTHSMSRSHGVAVVGNVFTHPTARGRGLGTVASSAVTAELLRAHRDVVLSVDPTNTPAIRAYRRLGYTDVGEIVEAGAHRRAGSLTTGLRRLLASYRGRREGVEILRG
jgi:GNAT superfamily N-acetyltransferase